jgi:hypothetical protein
MDQSRDRGVLVLSARVGQFPGRGMNLLNARDDLAANRAILVRRVNQVKEIRCYPRASLVLASCVPANSSGVSVGNKAAIAPGC